jgi:hypothetical protein
MLFALFAVNLSAGTKFQGLFLAVVVVAVASGYFLVRKKCPFRELDSRELLALGLVALGTVPLLGGVTYFDNLRHFGSLSGPSGEDVFRPGYGNFVHLWMFPILAFLVPFSSKAGTVWVPWRGERWWWSSDDLMFSHYGVLVSVALVVLPLCVWHFRKDSGDEARRIERRVATSLLVVLFFAFLPVRNGRWVCFRATYAMSPTSRSSSSGGRSRLSSERSLVRAGSGRPKSR